MTWFTKRNVVDTERVSVRGNVGAFLMHRSQCFERISRVFHKEAKIEHAKKAVENDQDEADQHGLCLASGVQDDTSSDEMYFCDFEQGILQTPSRTPLHSLKGKAGLITPSPPSRAQACVGFDDNTAVRVPQSQSKQGESAISSLKGLVKPVQDGLNKAERAASPPTTPPANYESPESTATENTLLDSPIRNISPLARFLRFGIPKAFKTTETPSTNERESVESISQQYNQDKAAEQKRLITQAVSTEIEIWAAMDHDLRAEHAKEVARLVEEIEAKDEHITSFVKYPEGSTRASEAFDEQEKEVARLSGEIQAKDEKIACLKKEAKQALRDRGALEEQNKDARKQVYELKTQYNQSTRQVRYLTVRLESGESISEKNERFTKSLHQCQLEDMKSRFDQHFEELERREAMAVDAAKEDLEAVHQAHIQQLNLNFDRKFKDLESKANSACEASEKAKALHLAQVQKLTSDFGQTTEEFKPKENLQARVQYLTLELEQQALFSESKLNVANRATEAAQASHLAETQMMTLSFNQKIEDLVSRLGQAEKAAEKWDSVQHDAEAPAARSPSSPSASVHDELSDHQLGQELTGNYQEASLAPERVVETAGLCTPAGPNVSFEGDDEAFHKDEDDKTAHIKDEDKNKDEGTDGDIEMEDNRDGDDDEDAFRPSSVMGNQEAAHQEIGQQSYSTQSSPSTDYAVPTLSSFTFEASPPPRTPSPDAVDSESENLNHVFVWRNTESTDTSRPAKIFEAIESEGKKVPTSPEMDAVLPEEFLPNIDQATKQGASQASILEKQDLEEGEQDLEEGEPDLEEGIDDPTSLTGNARTKKRNAQRKQTKARRAEGAVVEGAAAESSSAAMTGFAVMPTVTALTKSQQKRARAGARRAAEKATQEEAVKGSD